MGLFWTTIKTVCEWLRVPHTDSSWQNRWLLQLDNLDCLEPDPIMRKLAMQNEGLKLFWQGAENEEMTRLWHCQCSWKVPVRHQGLLNLKDMWVFNRRFHYRSSVWGGEWTSSP
jgi:hypothetical protein